jgi:hypothetical protein
MERRSVMQARTLGTMLRFSLLALAVGLGAGRLPAESKSAIKGRIHEKSQEIQEKVQGYLDGGGDPAKIGPLGQEVERLMKAGKLADAEKTMDRILAILRSGPSARRVPDEAGALPPPPAGGPRGPNLGPERSARLGRIPASAEIVYHANGYVYCMDADGRGATQLTFTSRNFEHVAASYDRRYVVANSPVAGKTPTSHIWIYDLQRGTEYQLVPNFAMAGNGGVVFDRKGYVYFAGLERPVYPSPRRREEFIANAGANDIYRVKVDGTGVQRLTNTADRGEADVSVSEDGTLIAYMATKINPPNDYTEIWVSNSDGSNRRLVYTGGKDRVSSVHDPEISPNNQKVVFSKVNSSYRNFRSDPSANTAHDLWAVNIDGTGATRLTAPGPISIVPCWKGNKILYLELTDQGGVYRGIDVMNADGTGRKRIKADANIARWIP